MGVSEMGSKASNPPLTTRPRLDTTLTSQTWSHTSIRGSFRNTERCVIVSMFLVLDFSRNKKAELKNRDKNPPEQPMNLFRSIWEMTAPVIIVE